ncbi:hypothetical protein SDC9_01105 [bioreactor metagenome]|jgi:hypothetical protein|uniref:Uncharacterized protein n=1 Tax=bioreactor metagenome TaxID=1076179 RepID=A0A644SMU4_9ZZZZ
MKIIYIITFYFSFILCYSQDTKVNSNEFSFYNSFEIEKKLKKESPKVMVLETCSNKANLCGIFAYGSLSLVKISSGEHASQNIYIVITCKETKYKVGKTYNLKISSSPNFSVILCNSKVYNPDWNSNLKENKYPIFFGILE